MEILVQGQPVARRVSAARKSKIYIYPILRRHECTRRRAVSRTLSRPSITWNGSQVSLARCIMSQNSDGGDKTDASIETLFSAKRASVILLDQPPSQSYPSLYNFFLPFFYIYTSFNFLLTFIYFCFPSPVTAHYFSFRFSFPHLTCSSYYIASLKSI